MIQDIMIKGMISSFCESMYLSYFCFQSNAWQDEGVIFFLSQSLSLKTIRVLLLKLSLVFERTSILSYSRFQSNVRQDESVMFYSSNWEEIIQFFLFTKREI